MVEVLTTKGFMLITASARIAAVAANFRFGGLRTSVWAVIGQDNQANRADNKVVSQYECATRFPASMVLLILTLEPEVSELNHPIAETLYSNRRSFDCVDRDAINFAQDDRH
jgi:hypothetical protein